MTKTWKVLVVCMAVFQIAQLIAFWRLSSYAIWLHFTSGSTGVSGAWDTAPGRSMGLLLLVVGVACVVFVGAAWMKSAAGAAGRSSGDNASRA